MFRWEWKKQVKAGEWNKWNRDWLVRPSCCGKGSGMLFILVYGFRSFSPASSAPLLLGPWLSRACNRSHSTDEDLETKTEGKPRNQVSSKAGSQGPTSHSHAPPHKVSFISKTLSSAWDLVFSEDTHGGTLHIQITATLLPGKYM